MSQNFKQSTDTAHNSSAPLLAPEGTPEASSQAESKKRKRRRIELAVGAVALAGVLYLPFSPLFSFYDPSEARLSSVDTTAPPRFGHRSPSIRVLVLTTYDQDEFAFGALSAGASGFLLKDTRTADLHQALRAVSSGDAILTPRITRELLNRHMLSPVASPRQRAARQRLDDLSPREREVADLVSQGLTNAEIAQRLVLAPDSVKKNVTRILTKLDLRDRVQLVILMRDAQS